MKKVKVITILILLAFVSFWYFFSGNLITRLSYPLECRGIIPNIIDTNYYHIIAFVPIGIAIRLWGLILAIGGEFAQSIIKHTPVDFTDMLYNVIGLLIGYGIYWVIKSTIRLIKKCL